MTSSTASPLPPSPASQDRQKWNARYRDSSATKPPMRPQAHPLAVRWQSRFGGGAMLDAACGMGKGVAGALGRFAPIYGVDVSDFAISTARRLFPEPDASGNPIRWIVADVTALNWPEAAFGLVCSFGFTDIPFLKRMRSAVKPGGMILYEGFSKRQLEVHPKMNPEWTLSVPELEDLFAGWEILETGETQGHHHLVHCAAVKPGAPTRLASASAHSPARG